MASAYAESVLPSDFENRDLSPVSTFQGPSIEHIRNLAQTLQRTLKQSGNGPYLVKCAASESGATEDLARIIEGLPKLTHNTALNPQTKTKVLSCI